MTAGVKAIYDALTEQFGPGKYFLDSSGRYVGNDPGVYWTHMGGWNRRYIGGTTVWSQHAYWNALDIGPYVGIKAQQKFIDFLRNHTTEGGYNTLLTPKEEEFVKQWAREIEALGSNGGYVKFVIPAVRKKIVTRDELQEALKGVGSGNVDSTARSLANKALAKLAKIKDALV